MYTEKGQRLRLHAGGKLLTFLNESFCRVLLRGQRLEAKLREDKYMWPVAELKGSRPQLFLAPLSCLKPLGHLIFYIGLYIYMQQSE